MDDIDRLARIENWFAAGSVVVTVVLTVWFLSIVWSN